MINPGGVAFWVWLLRKWWTPKPTHLVLGLPPPIAPQVLDVLDALQPDTPPRIAEQIQEDAEGALQKCLRARGVADGVYELSVGDPDSGQGHRVRRSLDGCTWSLHDFDDFIDLGLNPRGRE